MDAPTLGEFAEYVEALPGRLSLARRGMPQHSVGSDPVSPARPARLSRDRAPGRADDASAPYRSGRSGSRTLSGGLRILGDTHPDTVSSLANLALVQGQIGGPLHARPPRGEHGVRILIDDCVLQETLGESLTDCPQKPGWAGPFTDNELTEILGAKSADFMGIEIGALLSSSSFPDPG